MQDDIQIILPDLFSLTPIPWAGCNPNFTKDEKFSTEWILGYGVFPEKIRARIESYCIEILGANTFNYVDANLVR